MSGAQRMLATILLQFLILVSWSEESPVGSFHKDDEIRLDEVRRGILEDPRTVATDRIITINEATDVASQLFEGDIELKRDDLQTLSGSSSDDVTVQKRNAARMRIGVWRTRKVPYEVDSALVDEGYLEEIMAAIKAFHSETCIRWTPHNDEKNWIRFVKGTGCHSRVGKLEHQEGVQTITLGPGCKNSGTIMHEMMHAVGFWHEQSRPDRDKYVEVMWENIEADQDHNFDKYPHNKVDTLGTQYDYKSLMHYGRLSFSKNKKATIQALGDPNKELGQRNGFSRIDVIKINALYDCKSPSGGWSTWSSYSPCDANCYKYRQRYCTAEDVTHCPGANPFGLDTQTKFCNFAECRIPIDGHWGRWGSWSECSVTCDRGTHTRTRQCNDPKPNYGGKDCEGPRTDRQACDMKSCSLGKYDCDFEADGFCNWTQDEKDTNGDWERIKGSTPTQNTGPDEDHTSGSGYYIFMEASSGNKGGTTRLLSAQFHAGSKWCVQFWYHMYGLAMGTLRVLVKDSEVKRSRQLWDMTGDQGNEWKEGIVEVESSNAFQVVFEAVKGNSFFSDIALDDIKLSQGQCLKTHGVLTTESPPKTTKATTLLPTTTEVTTTLLRTTTEATTFPPTTTEATTTSSPTTEHATTLSPTTSRPPIDDFCDFGGSVEFEPCEWINDPRNSRTPDDYPFDWWWTRGPTQTRNTGPSGDHTTGNGHYLFLEASRPFTEGMKARLISPRYPAAKHVCLGFWYHMYGETIGKLSVYLHQGNGENVIWEKNGNQGNQWREAVVKISSGSQFEVIFEGIHGNGITGDIALDDILVKEGDCSSELHS